jgi:hypothetical protein
MVRSLDFSQAWNVFTMGALPLWMLMAERERYVAFAFTVLAVATIVLLVVMLVEENDDVANYEVVVLFPLRQFVWVGL